MKSLTYKTTHKACIWSGEYPEAVYPPQTEQTQSIASQVKPTREKNVVALEFYAPAGPRRLYGLLGAIHEPNSTDFLVINVLGSVSKGPLFEATPLTLQAYDEVRIGLPVEYIKGVFDGLFFHLPYLSKLGSGKLTVNCAAHGAITSSQNLFKNIAISLVKLLADNIQSLSDEKIIELLPQRFE